MTEEATMRLKLLGIATKSKVGTGSIDDIIAAAERLRQYVDVGVQAQASAKAA